MDNLKKIEFHVVSRDDHILLAQKLSFLKENIEIVKRQGIDLNVICHQNNKKGLCELYNEILSKSEGLDGIAFMHGDVDFNIPIIASRCIEESENFDIIGLAGTKKIDLHISPLSWFTGSKDFEEYRYGKITHLDKMATGESFFNYYKPEIKETRVCCIDGLFIYLNKSVIENKELRFDEHFKYDFYDLDFCMQAAVNHKMKIGVIIEPTIHESVGKSILTENFHEYEKIFKEKWEVQ